MILLGVMTVSREIVNREQEIRPRIDRIIIDLILFDCHVAVKKSQSSTKYSNLVLKHSILRHVARQSTPLLLHATHSPNLHTSIPPYIYRRTRCTT